MADVRSRNIVETSGLKNALHRGDFVTAALQSIPDPAITTILGWSGCDVVILDNEHGPYTLTELRHCVDAIHSTPASAIVRIPSFDAGFIKQVLELGITGILAPGVGTAREAADLVRACHYPPLGVRGTGTGRAARYGLAAASYRAQARDEVTILAMIETEEGVRNADEIVMVKGLDGVFIGPHDLATEMGVKDDDPAIKKALAQVVSAANNAGVAVGTTVDPRGITEARDSGMSLLLCYTDFAGLGRSSRDAFAYPTQNEGAAQ